MEHAAYLVVLLSAIGCLMLVDRRWRLAMFYDAGRTLRTVAAGVAFFVVWDVLGISLGVFRVGSSHFLTGIRLGHEFPIEEILFLTLFIYVTLLVLRGAERSWPRT